MVLQSNQRLPLYTKEGKTVLVCFNEAETETEEGVILYTYNGARIKFPYTYDSLVSGIIKAEYNDDEMQAIINNYLSDSTNEKYKTEFETMQNYRKLAKEIAKLVLAN